MNSVSFDMNGIHSGNAFRHKQTPDEDEMFCQLLSDMLPTLDRKIKKFGFPVNAEGEVLDHSQLTVIFQ